MPRFVLYTSSVESAYFATEEAHEKIHAYHDALRARYDGTEGDQIMYDALRYATANFTKKATGKTMLAYLDLHYRHVLPISLRREELLRVAASQGIELVDVSEQLDEFLNKFC